MCWRGRKGLTLLELGDGLMSMPGSRLKETSCLIQVNRIILDVIEEGPKRSFLISRAKGKASEFLRSFKLGDRHGKDKFGGDGTGEPNHFLRLSGGIEKAKIKIKDPGSPVIAEHKVGVLPGIIDMEDQEILLDIRG
jgi:hypothetical protein